jgi:hypothetical protein
MEKVTNVLDRKGIRLVSLLTIKGFYKGLHLIDSVLLEFQVSSSIKKIGNVGPFWGLNIFLNQKIRVELSFNQQARQLTLIEVKEKHQRHLRRISHFGLQVAMLRV